MDGGAECRGRGEAGSFGMGRSGSEGLALGRDDAIGKGYGMGRVTHRLICKPSAEGGLRCRGPVVVSRVHKRSSTHLSDTTLRAGRTARSVSPRGVAPS